MRLNGLGCDGPGVLLSADGLSRVRDLWLRLEDVCPAEIGVPKPAAAEEHHLAARVAGKVPAEDRGSVAGADDTYHVARITDVEGGGFADGNQPTRGVDGGGRNAPSVLGPVR